MKFSVATFLMHGRTIPKMQNADNDKPMRRHAFLCFYAEPYVLRELYRRFSPFCDEGQFWESCCVCDASATVAGESIICQAIQLCNSCAVEYIAMRCAICENVNEYIYRGGNMTAFVSVDSIVAAVPCRALTDGSTRVLLQFDDRFCEYEQSNDRRSIQKYRIRNRYSIIDIRI